MRFDSLIADYFQFLIIYLDKNSHRHNFKDLTVSPLTNCILHNVTSHCVYKVMRFYSLIYRFNVINSTMREFDFFVGVIILFKLVFSLRFNYVFPFYYNVSITVISIFGTFVWYGRAEGTFQLHIFPISS
jgi:hypothetical protein